MRVRHYVNWDTKTKVCSKCLIEKSLACFSIRTERNGVHSQCKECNKLYVKHPLINIWRGVFKRCYDQNHKNYDRYGARGIQVCKQWHSFETFVKWSEANNWVDGLTLDRINNNKGYSPSNCRWATRKEQGNNKSDNVVLRLNGKPKTIAQWSEELSIKRSTLYSRAAKGWPDEKILSKKMYWGKAASC